MRLKNFLTYYIFSPIERVNRARLKTIKHRNHKIRFAFYYIKYNLYQYKYDVQIPQSTKIGKNFEIGHVGGIVVNPDTIIGDDVVIFNGVTLGAERRGNRAGSPIIGNNVYLGPNSAIVGHVHIGNDVLIAPNSFINFDVPDHSVVLGCPGKIFHKDNATEGYIPVIDKSKL